MVVRDDKKKQWFWKLGLVEEVIPGKDGEVRGAVVRIYTGGKKCKHLRRPIQHLYPLEINCFSSRSGRGDLTNEVARASNSNGTKAQCELLKNQSRELVTQCHMDESQLQMDPCSSQAIRSETQDQVSQSFDQTSC